MATKFHWGHGIVVVLGIFIIFILSFVYKTIAKPEYDHKLVSEEYYKEEMYYQEEAERLNNAKQLANPVKVGVYDKGVMIMFPEAFKPGKIKGTYQLQRTNDASLDIKGNLNLNNSTLLIPDKFLKHGRYNVKILWTYDDIPYQINDKITY